MDEQFPESSCKPLVLDERYKSMRSRNKIIKIFLTRLIKKHLVSFISLSCILAPQLDGWNITAESITSTTILVTWSKVTHAISIQELYSFVAVCTAAGKKGASRLATANVSSSNALVQMLRPYTDYQVQVVALLKGQRNGTIAMKSSSVVVLRTKEDGEISFKMPRLPFTDFPFKKYMLNL